jgi:hypothetical protein
MTKYLLYLVSIALVFVGNAIFGDAINEQVTFQLYSWVGPEAATAVAFGAEWALPILMVGFFAFGIFGLGRHQGRREILDHLPVSTSASLPQMTAHQIAEHLSSRSVWAERKFTELIHRRFVRDHVGDEMRRLGLSGDVRYRGIRPNNPNAEDVDPAYWVHGRIVSAMLWDRNGRWSTIVGHNSIYPPPPLYHHLSAPRVDVLKAWPTASRARRMWSVTCVGARRTWFWISGWTETFIRRIAYRRASALAVAARKAPENEPPRAPS